MKSILVVEDDFAMRRGIALMLQGAGYRLSEARDNIEALKALQRHPVDLVILDLFLPGKDGIEIAEDIAGQYPGMKILLLTAFGEHERAREARAIFGSNFLEKSSLDKVLVKKIQSLFE